MKNTEEVVKMTDDFSDYYFKVWFHEWKPNVLLIVKKNKSKLHNTQLCPDKNITGLQGFIGNCDRCRYFLDCEFEISEGKVHGCCGLILNKTLKRT